VRFEPRRLYCHIPVVVAVPAVGNLPGGFKKSASFCRDLLLFPIKELLAQGNQRVEDKGRKKTSAFGRSVPFRTNGRERKAFR